MIIDAANAINDHFFHLIHDYNDDDNDDDDDGDGDDDDDGDE